MSAIVSPNTTDCITQPSTHPRMARTRQMAIKTYVS